MHSRSSTDFWSINAQWRFDQPILSPVLLFNTLVDWGSPWCLQSSSSSSCQRIGWSRGVSLRWAYATFFKKLKPGSHPKSQPKPATAGRAANNGVTARGRGRGGRRGRNAGRNKPKTADELDAEMVDYFDAPGTTGGNTGTDGTAINGAGSAAANGEDLGMDEISVSGAFSSPWWMSLLIITRTVNSQYQMIVGIRGLGIHWVNFPDEGLWQIAALVGLSNMFY